MTALNSNNAKLINNKVLKSRRFESISAAAFLSILEIGDAKRVRGEDSTNKR